MMKATFCLLTGLIFFTAVSAKDKLNFYPASDAKIIYMGRIDFSDKLKPVMWATAAQVQFSFKGTSCKVIITDEEQYGKDHNYIDIIVDGNYRRIKLTAKHNEIEVANHLADKKHHVIISKSTEAGIGYIKFEGLYCSKLQQPQKLPNRKIEFFGDSITSGMGSDTSTVPCHKAAWYDETNGYLSYGAIAARTLNAQYHITSVSGIGLIHSCCEMDIVMPQVYDKISLRNNKIPWDFSAYQPDIVSICLGQNDGIQDSVKYCGAYVKFIEALRGRYPKALFMLLSSPMADAGLLAQTKKYLPAVASATGDKNVVVFYFSKQFIAGCDSHPSLTEHAAIAKEFAGFVKNVKNW